jgi:hypothetical protein
MPNKPTELPNWIKIRVADRDFHTVTNYCNSELKLLTVGKTALILSDQKQR